MNNINDEIRKQYKERTEHNTFTVPVSEIAGPSPRERALGERLRKQAEAEAHDDAIRTRENQLRKQRGLPLLPKAAVTGEEDA
jgi:hypothetical protein